MRLVDIDSIEWYGGNECREWIDRKTLEDRAVPVQSISDEVSKTIVEYILSKMLEVAIKEKMNESKNSNIYAGDEKGV